MEAHAPCARHSLGSSVNAGMDLANYIPQLSLDEEAGASGARLASAIRRHGQVPKPGVRSLSPDLWYRAWRHGVEALGALVLQTRERVDPHVVRGMSLPSQPIPIINLSSGDTPAGRTFSLLHELVHVALNGGGICSPTPGAASAAMERYCDAVAASALMPASFIATFPRLDSVADPTASLMAAARLSGASREALLYRFRELGRVSEAVFAQLLAEVRQSYPQGAKGPSRVPRDTVALSRVGYRFARLVGDAFKDATITETEAARYLDRVPRAYLERVVRRAEGAGR